LIAKFWGKTGGEILDKKNLLGVLLAFCLTIVLLLAIPTRSNPTIGEYDPWADFNDDGTIDMYDVGYTARLYGAAGTAINKTELLLQLQDRIIGLEDMVLQLQANSTALEDMVLQLQANSTALEDIVLELQDKIAELEERVSFLETLHGLPFVWEAGLMGYWKFDEGSGDTAFDTSGSNNNGTLMGPTWVDGRYDMGLHFDGIDDYLLVNGSATLQVSAPFTLELWAKVGGTTGSYQIMLDHGWNGNNSFYLMEFQPNGVVPQFAVFNDASVNGYAVSSINVQIGDWVHLVGTYDKYAVRIYVNGTLAGDNYLTGGLNVTDKPINVGARSDLNYYFNGTVDNVVIYNRALSAEEVMFHYLYPPP